MNEEEAMELVGLVKAHQSLPTKIEDLVRLRVAAEIMVHFHQDVLRKIKSGDLQLAEEDRKSKLADGQAIGEMLLNAEAKIGELLPSAEETLALGRKTGTLAAAGRQYSRVLPDGIDGRRAQSARAIKSNPAAMAAIIKEARENEDIPTKTAVLNRIRYEQEKARPKKDSGEFVASAEEAKYLHALEWIISELPTMPPKKWSDRGLALATGYAKIIRKRLEVFANGSSSKVLS